MKRAFLLVAASSVALAAAAPALAQTSGQTSGQASAQPAQVDDIVVTGAIVSGERRALNIQKNADNILNVVSSDGIGRLPDRNAAEAVQRAPGVAIERDQGEGRFVAVRGLPSQWNSTLINGDRLPTAEEETTNRRMAPGTDFDPLRNWTFVELFRQVRLRPQTTFNGRARRPDHRHPRPYGLGSLAPTKRCSRDHWRALGRTRSSADPSSACSILGAARPFRERRA